MFSPLEAVKGHDRTYVRRMSTAEYLEEIHAEDADITGKPLVHITADPTSRATALRSASVNQCQTALPGILKKKGPVHVAPSAAVELSVKPADHVWEFERRREALTSQNPRVTFSSRYPSYDRLGYELCVLYQFQDMTVQQEMRRIATHDARTRRSGVRLSAELELDRTASRVLSVRSRGAHQTALGDEGDDEEEHARASSTGKSLVRPSHIHHALPPLSTRPSTSQEVGSKVAADEELDVSVSEMSRTDDGRTCAVEGGSTSRASSYSSRGPSRLASERPSEFSIYRDSALRASQRRPSQKPLKATSAPPAPRVVITRDACHTDGGVSGGGGVLDYRTSHAPAVLLRGHSTSPTPNEDYPREAAHGARISRARSLSGPPLTPVPLVEHPAPHPYLVPTTDHAVDGTQTKAEAEADTTAGDPRAFSSSVAVACVLRDAPRARGYIPMAGRKRFASRSEPPPTMSAVRAVLDNTAAADDVDDEGHTVFASRLVGKPPVVPTAVNEVRGLRVSPVPLDSTRVVAAATGAAGEDPLFASRESTAVRATKQLFRGTLFGSGLATGTTALGRGTTSVTHKQLIPSTLYGGPSATHILASAVAPLVEENLERCATLSDAFFTSSAAHAPELQSGHIVSLEGGDGTEGGSEGGHKRRWFKLVRFVVTADAYEAIEVEPVDGNGENTKKGENDEKPGDNDEEETRAAEAVTGGEGGEDGQGDGEKGDEEAVAGAPGSAEPASSAEVARVLRAEEVREPLDVSALAPVMAAAQFRLKRSPTDTSEAMSPVQDEDASQRFLIYRWRDSLLPMHGHEARRAALGLSLVAPEVHVSGYRYVDGSGVTVLALPPRFRAVPVASLPHQHADSFLCCVKLLAKLLSSMVPRRTVHGNMEGLAEVFLVAPVLPTAPDGSSAEHSAPLTAPLIVPVHWERLVDFNMFADRAAGRSIPYDTQEAHGSGALSLLRQGSDVQGVLQAVLEHKLAPSLPNESYTALQKLLVMANQPAPMANLLVEISNLLASLPNSLPALYRAHGAAVNFYKRIYVE